MLAEMTGKRLVLNEMEPFSETLKKLRGPLVSQQELAAKAGMVVSTISKLERGESRPSRKTIIQLAPALNVSVEELLKLAGLERGKSPRVAIAIPRELYERAMQYAEAQGVDGEEWVAAAVEALMRLHGSPEEARKGKSGVAGKIDNRKATFARGRAAKNLDKEK